MFSLTLVSAPARSSVAFAARVSAAVVRLPSAITADELSHAMAYIRAVSAPAMDAASHAPLGYSEHGEPLQVSWSMGERRADGCRLVSCPFSSEINGNASLHRVLHGLRS